MGDHVRPASVVFHTPPFTAAMKNVCGWLRCPAAATVRLPRCGPIARHFMAARSEGLIAGVSWAGTDASHPANTSPTARTKRRMDMADLLALLLQSLHSHHAVFRLRRAASCYW